MLNPFKMKKLFFCLLIFISSIRAIPQYKTSALSFANSEMQRPKLVVGIVVDQMRWDFLYRYYDRYLNDGGFKRLLSQGFSCENTILPYAPTVTACGHASIYTGSVPAINGITGNDWWDYKLAQMVYCTGDEKEITIGNTGAAGQMSPRNLLVTTIGDELRLATNFKSKVIGIALKDRGAILPAGHSANAAYWYNDKTGDWISSSYFINELPVWVKELNAKKLVDRYFALDWKTIYPLNTYLQSSPDEVPWEHKPFGAAAKGFPYSLSQFAGKNYERLPVTPYGNSYTFDMAKASISGESLGADSVTDLLAISLSSPDYIGHNFGPNSVETEDDYLRLDKDLGEFLNYLDNQIGRGGYLVFLTADHGVSQVPAFLNEHKIPAGSVAVNSIEEELAKILKEKFMVDSLLIGLINYQVFLDHDIIKKTNIKKDSINKTVIDFLMRQPGISRAFALDALDETTLNSNIRHALQNGYFPSRSGDIQILYDPQWIDGFEGKGTTHGVWNPYDAHIPLLWFGWHVLNGKSNREIYMTDIAPTIAAMLHIQMPSGSIGKVIEELAR
jgi:predicted AlkP superfamily pyrophosphatase or phosphodiesterase